MQRALKPSILQLREHKGGEKGKSNGDKDTTERERSKKPQRAPHHHPHHRHLYLTVTHTALEAMPHMLWWLRAISMYPLMPQAVPQLFCRM